MTDRSLAVSRQPLTHCLDIHVVKRGTRCRCPYGPARHERTLSHLLAVAALVLEHGGTEVQATAAVLHDVVEDCEGLHQLEDVRAVFGDEVA